MSYARFSDADVYVIGTFRDDKDAWECIMCRLQPQDVATILGEDVFFHRDFVCSTRREMIEHLKEHREAGDRVPDYATDRLVDEMNVLERIAEEL